MKNGSIKGLEQFMALAWEHGVSFSVVVDHGRNIGKYTASVGYPRKMKPKLRDAMRDWAAHHRIELFKHLLTIMQDGTAEHTMTPFEQAAVEAMKASTERVDNSITPLN